MLPMHKCFWSGPKICVWASSIFFSKRQGQTRKKKRKQMVQKLFVPSPIRTPIFADFMPSFFGGGEVGPSFHSFIVQFLPYFLHRKTEMFFAYESGVQFSSIFMHLCMQICDMMSFPRQKPPRKVPQCLFPWQEHFEKLHNNGFRRSSPMFFLHWKNRHFGKCFF